MSPHCRVVQIRPGQRIGFQKGGEAFIETVPDSIGYHKIAALRRKDTAR
jgi:hypothetical protein